MACNENWEISQKKEKSTEASFLSVNNGSSGETKLIFSSVTGNIVTLRTLHSRDFYCLSALFFFLN